ncbi:MAG: restriction endonuclease subunit S [Collinsella sp.]|nr:restriction endonuclease subunit S [Collinsella sp.]
MSRIDELVAELCPDGVEYKQLWQVTTWDKRFNGVDRAKQPAINPHHYYLAKELQPVLAEQGNIKVLTTNQTSLYTTEDLVDESHIKDGEIIAIPWGGNAVVQYYKGRYITSDNRIAVVNTESIMTKFLFHVLKSREEELSSYYRGAGIKHPEMSKVLGMEIPVPPIEVQREIVRILDAFTELTDTMTEELEARKAQYSYYRDRLLSRESLEALDGKPVEMVRLGDVAEIRSGWGFPKQYQGNSTGDYPFYKVRDMNSCDSCKQMGSSGNYVSKEVALALGCKPAPAGTVIFPKIGAAIATNKKRILVCDSCYDNNVMGLIPNENALLPRYLLYLLVQFDLTTVASQSGAAPSIRKSSVEQVEIPVPSLETQRKVVDILDRFDALTTSLTDGIPAEIEARKAQNAYYRDRLLDFPRKSGDAS